MIHLLLVEDEPGMRELLANNLRFEGFAVDAAVDGAEALDRLRRGAYDLAVMDLMLPKMDGFQVLHALRQSGNALPVLMLTARGAEQDRVQGLGAGADDYMTKPFSTLELVARIRAILRRTGLQTETALFRSGPYLIHHRRQQVYAEGRSLNLTALEFRLVQILTSNPNVPFSREELLQLAWGGEEAQSSRKLNVHIANLRKKLAEVGGEAPILTMGGVGRSGYLWSEPVKPEIPKPGEDSVGMIKPG